MDPFVARHADSSNPDRWSDATLTAVVVLVVAMYVFALVSATLAYRKARQQQTSVLFGSLPGLHLVFAFALPFMEIVLGIVEYCSDPAPSRAQASAGKNDGTNV